MATGTAEIPGLVLEQELGRGAYSVVYRARKGTRRCAVKIARRGGRSTRWFRREAAALARVGHRGVPAVLEIGELEGRPFLVMELVDGESLADRLARGRMSAAQTLALGRDLLSIVEAVHARGLVHRDIKPRNILIDDDGVRLVDFGLVTPMYGIIGEGERAGTPSYAAPEQLHAPQLVDARADLYAIGRVLSQCVRSEDTPAGLAEVIGHLAAEPISARYASAAVAAGDLARVVEGRAPRGPNADPSGPSRGGDPPPLVGRKRSQRSLREAWSSARAGRGRVVLVEGAPGAGKTRLVAAFAARIARSEDVLQAGAIGGSPVPLAAARALVEQLLTALERRPGAAPGEVDALLRRLTEGATAATVATLSPQLAARLGDPAPPRDLEPEAFVEATAALILGLVSAGGPTMLVVDDLQWLDPASREVLVRVALGASAVPLLFVTAARTDARSLPPLQRFGRALGRERLAVLDLPALDDRELAELIGAWLGVGAPDPALVARVAGLTDGTPMSALEILASLVDGGALAPHWGEWSFDAARAEQIELPHGVAPLLERRLRQLPAAAIRTLEIAAVVGARFGADRVARVAGVRPADLQIALREASQAGLVDMRGERPGFVHDTVRDALLRTLTPGQRAAIHQRVALALDGERSDDDETVFAVADHFARGEPLSAPDRALVAVRRAAERAAARLDHEVALRFFELAERCAGAAGVALDGELLRGLAESRIRVGALEESLITLARAIELSEGLARAELRARVAWVHQMMAQPELAWSALADAFGDLGERLPIESPRDVAASLGRSLLAGTERRVRGAVGPGARARLELLCRLHYQNARLGIEYERPLRILQSALAIRRHGERLGPSAHLAMAHAYYGVLVTFLGRRRSGQEALALAREMAERVGDPVAQMLAMQHDCMVALWTGDMDRGIPLVRATLERYAPWLEVTEYCLVAASAVVVDAVRGRPSEALQWLELALQRVRRHGRAPAVVSQLMAPVLHSTLAALGREHELERLLPDLVPEGPKTRSFFRMGAWGPRAHRLLSQGRLGAELEALVAEFQAEGYNPRRVHLAVAEYYVVIAHARAAQCRRAAPADRDRRVAELDRALEDLRKAARIPLVKAHLRVLQGERALLEGDHPRARRCFDQARPLAEQQTCPWVLGAVALGEARILRAQGKLDAARDEARVAAVLAGSHGAAARVREISTEFDLRPDDLAPTAAPPSPDAAGSSDSSARAQLRALLSVVRTGAPDAGLKAHGTAVLDELVRIAGAERGVLLFERATTEPARLLLGRLRTLMDWEGLDPLYVSILQRVCDRGRALLPSGETGDPEASVPLDAQRLIAVPLWLQHDVVGALLLERAAAEPPFSSAESELVAGLVPQVPLALELARVLEERQRLDDTLRHAQKMEAVGQLASGVAHDFNNMLAAIVASLDVLEEGQPLAGDKASALGIVRDSVHRASSLTRQLLAFSRRQVLDLVAVDVGDTVEGLLPMLQRLLPTEIRIALKRIDAPCRVHTDPTSLEQAIVNLVVNARDAMADGGEITITVDAVSFDESWLAQGASRAGPHVRIDVADTGHGMSPEILAKVFEPFFTTKAMGAGTGLGLASLYGFVKQCGGHVEVRSDVGAGATFSIFLPRSGAEPEVTAPGPALVRPSVQGTATILLVEDEPLVRRSTSRALERAGFEVVFATNGVEALELLGSGQHVDLVVTDVMMPQMDGPSFVRHLSQLGIDVPVLLVSAYPDQQVADGELLGGGVEFLQKPFTLREIGDRVRRMLGR